MAQAQPVSTSASSPAPSDTVLIVRRKLPAPRAEVFRAWTEPDQIRAWSCPEGFKVVESIVELRTGGAYKLGMLAPDGGIHTSTGTYQEVRPPERLVYTWRWHDPDSPETLVTVEFHDLGQETELVLRHERFLTASNRDGHLNGWTGIVVKLDAYLAAKKSGVK
jgi:uncharacterized protein YndB with AHSA1/START domain